MRIGTFSGETLRPARKLSSRHACKRSAIYSPTLDDMNRNAILLCSIVRRIQLHEHCRLTAQVSRAFARWYDPLRLQVTVGELSNSPLHPKTQHISNNVCLHCQTHGVFHYQCLGCHSICQESQHGIRKSQSTIQSHSHYPGRTTSPHASPRAAPQWQDGRPRTHHGCAAPRTYFASQASC